MPDQPRTSFTLPSNFCLKKVYVSWPEFFKVVSFSPHNRGVCLITIPVPNPAYPAGQNYSLELMFAKFATAKIAKNLNPLN